MIGFGAAGDGAGTGWAAGVDEVRLTGVVLGELLASTLSGLLRQV